MENIKKVRLPATLAMIGIAISACNRNEDKPVATEGCGAHSLCTVASRSIVQANECRFAEVSTQPNHSDERPASENVRIESSQS